MTTIQTIAKLYPSPANVRKTGAKEGIDGLATSIHNHGLLNSLVVQPGGEKGHSRFSPEADGWRR
jgi:ParB-like chromosome segregation protein Spo0J